MATATRLRDLIYVVIAFVLIYLLFSTLIESPPPQVTVSEQGATVTLHADRSGHFRGEGEINGVPVEFLLDTGASYLSIPQSMAKQLRLDAGTSSSRVLLETAAGQVTAHKVVVDSVRFAVIEQSHVAAVVVPELKQPLLGMNFLKRLTIRQQQGTMTLRVE